MRKSIWIIALLSAALSVRSAHAETFDYTVSGADSGTLSITESAGLITGVSGVFDSAAIDALLAPGFIGGNDNLYFTSDPIFDTGGLAFSLAGFDSFGYTIVNLYYSIPAGGYESFQTGGSPLNFGLPLSLFQTISVTPTLAPTPEPDSGILLLGGIGMLALMIRKRHNWIVGDMTSLQSTHAVGHPSKEAM